MRRNSVVERVLSLLRGIFVCAPFELKYPIRELSNSRAQAASAGTCRGFGGFAARTCDAQIPRE